MRRRGATCRRTFFLAPAGSPSTPRKRSATLSTKKRPRRMNDSNRTAAGWLLAVVSFSVLIAACLIGPAGLSAGEALSGFFSDSASGVIVREIRLPRALAAWLAGATLGASGAAMQGLLRNPLADPGVLGVSAM